MKRYAHVKFTKHGKEGADQQQEMMRDMNRLGIISITEERMREFYEKDCESESGVCIHNYVLHGCEEWRKFRKLMKSPKYEFGMEGTSWWITYTPQNDSFRKWLKKQKERKTECQRIYSHAAEGQFLEVAEVTKRGKAECPKL